MSKPKTGDELDQAAKFLTEEQKRQYSSSKAKPVEIKSDRHSCEHCESLFEELPHAMGVVLKAIDHLGPEGIVSLGYNEETGTKFKAIFKKEEISNAEFDRIKASQDEEVRKGAWWGKTNGFDE